VRGASIGEGIWSDFAGFLIDPKSFQKVFNLAFGCVFSDETQFWSDFVQSTTHRKRRESPGLSPLPVLVVRFSVRP
jgi:hypothetical protein